MIRSVFIALFAVAMAATLPLAAEETEAVSPAAEVQQATDRHLEVLSGLIDLDEVPAAAQARIEKAIEISRRGGMKALEALSKADLGGVEVEELMDGSQLRGLEKAIDSIERASARASEKLQDALGQVPAEASAEASELIANAIERIGEIHAMVMARLGGLLERGVSTARPPERPDRPDAGRPSDVRPVRPDLPTQVVRPEIVRPARPELPSRPDPRP